MLDHLNIYTQHNKFAFISLTILPNCDNLPMAQFFTIEAEPAQNLSINRNLVETLIERLVDLLDCIDGDADFEADF